MSYEYDQLSRMTSESRTFTNVGTFTIGYGYNLAGQVTSVTDPWSAQIGYTRDITGRLTAVTGSGYANVSETGYASEFEYRAWGALKSMTYGNSVPLALTYTNRMQVSNYNLTITQGQTPSMNIDYSYAADGRLKLSTDHNDAKLDRAYKYDQVGRLVEAFTASEARSWVQSGSIGSTVDGPYRQSYTMDAWDNMTTKWGRSYTGTLLRTQDVNHTYSATTGRNNAWYYDNDGRVSADDINAYTYDEAGLLRDVDGAEWGVGRFEYDGDGRRAKKLEVPNSNPPKTFYLHSSVLGQTIAEIEGADGSRKYGFVYADGQLIATQAVGVVFWQHTDASGKSRRTTLTGGGGQGRDEVDPMDVKLDPPNLHQFNQGGGGGGKGAGGAEARVASLMDLRMCDFAGMLVPCGVEQSLREQLGQSPRELGLFWAYGWWSGASYGTAYSYYATYNPFKLLALRRGLLRKRTPPKKSFPKPMTKAEREKKERENSGVGADENEPQNTSQGLNAVEGQKRWDDCMNKYLPGDFPGGRNKPTGNAVGAANRASGGNTNDSALILAIIAKESGFNPTPTQDHGPMQLTAWVKNYLAKHSPDLIVPGSYDPFGRKSAKSRNRPFTGDYDANVQTGANWILYQRNNLGISDYKIAHGWGPGPTAAIRKDYADDASTLRNLYAPFLNCLNTGQ